MKRELSGFLLLASLAAPCAMAADAYQVELIVFRQSSPAANNEVWPPLLLNELPDTVNAITPDAALTATPAAVSVNPSANQEPGKFVLLDPSAYQLQGTWDALTRNNKYEPLLHIAWQQPGLDEPDTKTVRVQMGQPVPLTGQISTDESAPAAVFADPGRYPPATAENNATEQTSPVLYSPLDGTATLTVNFYMFLQLDLVLTPTPPTIDGSLPTPATPVSSANDQAVLEALARGELTLEQAQSMRTSATTTSMDGEATAAGITGYRLHESRRLKLNEINYFDNPMFGVIAQVRPVDFPDEAEENQNGENPR